MSQYAINNLNFRNKQMNGDILILKTILVY